MNRRWERRDQGTVLLGAAAIVAFALCLGLVMNQFSSRGLPLFASEETLRPETPAEVAYIGLEEVSRRRAEPGTVVIDARSSEDFAALHLDGAVSLPVSEFSSQLPSFEKRLRAATLLVCYCESIACDDGARLAALLSSEGYHEVVLMYEGLEGWQGAGYPVSSDRVGGK